MKVKCPAGCGEYDSTLINDVQSELDIHIANNHDDPIKMLCNLLIKIHKMIEIAEEYDDEFKAIILPLLKSLLEK